MLRRSVAVLVFILVACGPGPTSGPTASTTPVLPVGTLTPSPNTQPSPSPSPTPDVPITKVDFSCRLPVVTRAGGGDVVTLQGGFITFPAAQLAVDPSGTIQSRSPGEGFATTASPVLVGSGGNPFYDRAQSRWVPVPPSQARADGSAYAYAMTELQTNRSKVYVVQVASGETRAFDLPSPQYPFVADYGAAGIYLLSASAIGGPGQGVWLLDPATGNVRQVRNLNQAWAVRDGYAWVARLDSRDKTVWSPMEIAPADSLVRIDLATGAETEWFYQAGRYPWMIGLASRGRPVIVTGGPEGNEFRLMDQPGSPEQLIYKGNSVPLGDVQGDRDRIWFGSASGIYLYSPNRGFQKVFSYGADPANYPFIQPAGFCL